MDEMSAETVDDIAERIDRAGDRYHNAGDLDRESESRTAAAAVRGATSLDRAREIARAFESAQRIGSNGEGAPLGLSGRSPRRPWWKKWRKPGETDDSDDS
jgi:hypothetical protein